MRHIAILALAFVLAAPAAFAAEQAKEIAFSRPAAGAEGRYVLHVATDASLPPSCPKGFVLIKDQKPSTLSDGKLQVFACVKG